MTVKTTITVQDTMKAAFQALLNGDTKTRDELVGQVERQMNGRQSIPNAEPMTYQGKIIDGDYSVKETK